MELKHTVETFIRVYCCDFEALVAKTYGLPHEHYLVRRDLGCVHDSVQHFTVKKGVMGERMKQKLSVWHKSRPGLFLTSHVLLDLCNKSVIDEGEYGIYVWW